MNWIAPPEMPAGTDMLERYLWPAADQFRTNSGLKPQAYSQLVLGLSFLRLHEAIILAKGIQDPHRTGDRLLPRLLSDQVVLESN